MNSRRKRNIYIGILCLTLVFMSIGFAVASRLITISGTSSIAGKWNIYIDSITPHAYENASNIRSEIGADKLSATFEARLLSPGDYVEYKIVVKNDGNIKAKLAAVDQLVQYNTNNYVKYSNTATSGYILGPGETYAFYVKAELDESITELKEKTNPVLTINLNFVQNIERNPDGTPTEESILARNDASRTNADSVSWTYDKYGVLYFTGSGRTNDQTDKLNSLPTTISDIKTIRLVYQIPMIILNNYDSEKYPLAMFFNESDGQYELNEQIVSILRICMYPDSTLKEFVKDSMGVNINTRYDFLNFLSKNKADIGLDDATFEFVKEVASLVPQISDISFENANGITSFSDKYFEELGYDGPIYLPQSLVEINDFLFENNNISYVSIPEGVTYIGFDAFIDNNLKTVIIPNSVTTIESFAFQGNNLTSVVLPEPANPESTSKLGSAAFGYNNINSLIINGTYSEFNTDAFTHNGMTSDENIELGNTNVTREQVSEIYSYAQHSRNS